jgi:phosphoribosyl 1,2-cyclic phosphodiesterase
MLVRFWGVRGSTPTPEIQNLGYGGNTSCVEVRSDENDVLIFDGGSGVRRLGQSLHEEFRDQKLSVSMFLSHFHWDHIQGIPFFLPLYVPENEMTFYAGKFLGPLQERLHGQMSKPYFPVSLDVGARSNFVEVDSGKIEVGRLRIHPFRLHHPQGSCGYRVESQRGSIVFAMDREHGDPHLDREVREYSQQADILIYDAQYTPAEYPSHRGWGHSTWEEGVKVARDAGVKQLILCHHDPWHNDQDVLEIQQQARAQFENTLAATEGWSAVI